jgi:hypothetical protein
MNTQIKALAQHLDIEFFDFDGETYTGATLEDFNEVSGSNYEDVEDIDTDDEPFKIWLGLNCTLLEDEIVVSSYDDNILEYEGAEYLVVNDETADELWEQSLDNYLEECISPEFTGNLSSYFDDEKWKRDARYDGRGHSLSSYDGNENYEDVTNDLTGQTETFYIYRTN